MRREQERRFYCCPRKYPRKLWRYPRKLWRYPRKYPRN
jgi:hypothetical protein